MTTLFRRDANEDFEITPSGEEDEVDIYFVRDDNDDVQLRDETVEMDIPAASSVVPPATVFDAETGENVIGTATGGSGGDIAAGSVITVKGVGRAVYQGGGLAVMP